MFRRRSFSTFCTSAPASMDDHEVRALFLLVKDMERKTWKKWTLLSYVPNAFTYTRLISFPYDITYKITTMQWFAQHTFLARSVHKKFANANFLFNLSKYAFWTNATKTICSATVLICINFLGVVQLFREFGVYHIMFLCKGIYNPYMINYYFLRSKINSLWLSTNFI
jgi:hypothetical protein